MPDDLDRDKLYTAGADHLDSDDADLELEPLDPAVLAAEARRAAEAIEAHRSSIDINEVYRDLDANRDSEIVAEWLARWRNFRFQFQVKHLLILTAVVAMVLALKNVFGVGFGTLFILAIMLAIAGVTLYLKLEENKRQEAADRRRQKMYAQRRAQQARASGQVVEVEEIDDEPPSKLHDDVRQPAATARVLRFQFSLAQLFAAMTAAALLLGLVSLVGGASNVATLCGLLALAGFLIAAFGYEPPEIVVFGWWMLLVLYIALSLFSAIWAGLVAA